MLYGFGPGDDTGAYKLSDDLVIVQSVDFFTPVVDDPYLFGQIAAANALSDLYATGARPVSALNILAFPTALGMETASMILRGGAEKVREAGAALLGGHSVADKEPKYGLAVTGVVDPARMVTIKGAKPGDAVILTSKIGTGIITSMKRNDSFVSVEDYTEMTDAMAKLNNVAGAVMSRFPVTSCTDVTGFGLLGHAMNIAEASDVNISISCKEVPRYRGALENALQHTKGGGERNHSWIENSLNRSTDVEEASVMLFCDPQTSGGLLITVPEKTASALLNALKGDGETDSAIIGHVSRGPTGISLLP